VDYAKIQREIMKFVLKQNNDKMLNVYRNWCQNHLGRKIENLEKECSQIEFLLEIIQKSTGIRCHERIKGQSQMDDVGLILEELTRNQCQTTDITPKGKNRISNRTFGPKTKAVTNSFRVFTSLPTRLTLFIFFVISSDSTLF
jgi:hypothetical protein